MTEAHRKLSERLILANDDAWLHLQLCFLKQFFAAMEKSILIVEHASGNNGEVHFEDTRAELGIDDSGSAQVGLLDLNLLPIAIDTKLSKQAFFTSGAGSTQFGAFGRSAQKFRKTVIDGVAIISEFLELAECALIQSVPRFRELHHGKI